MTDKEQRKVVDKLIKELEGPEGFGKACKDFCIDCGGCKGQLLIAMLHWYKDLLEY